MAFNERSQFIMKKVIIFLSGLGIGVFLGYAFGKKRAEIESEEIISDMRRKNREDLRKLKKSYDDSVNELGVNFVKENEDITNIKDYKKFKSLEEDDKLKNILGKKTSILTEDEYDYLRKKNWDYEVVEYHSNGGVFTYENGDKFTLFKDNGIEEEVIDAVLKASYEVGAFACIKTDRNRKIYEVVRIDDIEDPKSDPEDDDPFIEFSSEIEMIDEMGKDNSPFEIYYNVDKNSYFSDPDETEEIEDPFDGKEVFFDSGDYYIKNSIKNTYYILTVHGADADDSDDEITEGDVPEDPRFISEEEFSEDLNFDKKEIMYYMDTKEFIDEDGFRIDNPSNVFPRFNPKPEAVYYCRNFDTETDYMITVVPEDA